MTVVSHTVTACVALYSLMGDICNKIHLENFLNLKIFYLSVNFYSFILDICYDVNHNVKYSSLNNI